MSLCLVVICCVTMSCSELCQCVLRSAWWFVSISCSAGRCVWGEGGGGGKNLQIRLLGVKLQAEYRNAYRVACHLD